MKIRTYSELRMLDSFKDRFDYLRLEGQVGSSTFGFDRYINQSFYRSAQWKHIRNAIIVRDEGCDLGVSGYEIYDKILIHHMNPMTPDQLQEGDTDVLNPEYLITVSLRTHNAIHFGDESQLAHGPIERRPGDTSSW